MAVGARLSNAPYVKTFIFLSGSRNSNPQRPPQTMRGYRKLAVRAGAIATPAAPVIPTAPKNQIARPLAIPPRLPAAK